MSDVKEDEQLATSTDLVNVETDKSGRWVKTAGHWQFQPADGGRWDGSEFRSPWKPEPDDGDFWGQWVYDCEARVLTHRRTGYEVPLSAVNSADRMKDWIAQILEKHWPDPDIDSLVLALDDLIGLRSL